MPFCCHSEKMLWNPSIEVDVVITSASHWLQSQVDNCPASCWEIENDSSPINLYLAMLLIGTNWAGVSWAAMWPYWTPLWQNRTSLEYYNFLQVGLQPKASQRSEDTAGPLSLVGPQVSPAVGGYALYGHEVHFTLSVCFPYQVVHKDSV